MDHFSVLTSQGERSTDAMCKPVDVDEKKAKKSRKHLGIGLTVMFAGIAVAAGVGGYFGSRHKKDQSAEGGSGSDASFVAKADSSSLCLGGSPLLFPDRGLENLPFSFPERPTLSKETQTCAELDASLPALSLSDFTIFAFQNHCGCPETYGAGWCETCGDALGLQCDTQNFKKQDTWCPEITSLQRPVDPKVFDNGLLMDWYVTHGTVEWNIWPAPTFSMDLSQPWMEYSAFMYDSPSAPQDCCKYTKGENREKCATAANHTYSPYIPYTNDFPMLDFYSFSLFDGKERQSWGTGLMVNATVLDVIDDVALINICVHYQMFPYDWGPNFVIWAKDWRNVSSATVALYEARIQDLLGEDIELIQKPPPVDPQAPYDEDYIDN